VLKNACQEDFDAGVVYEDGSAPIVDMYVRAGRGAIHK
jgi:hypothetical protein